ncbi:NADH:flavin oxidoreductase/NADH oxidase [Amphiplicatus metriothermophilus]|uniref:2,4-dienoyl-CoA reductase n=1 Tax=Amphiplicatus metriothermophilus TaxID=1519374 RepID=A0A239PZQ5_9PROT|nr:NADH:flavin oxidoreductase/NADH oxidase [Amphiplicatus metriothermophilus]MBB5518238.1 NADPH2 dehydrogenase [Amphiplicatus metriothermophilus]SNT75446.1 2,4-dienoyl-CoA reductase [Amphiplicatus metriothermophilus]
MTTLFDSFRLKDVALRNRIVVSPMCQYSAEEGVINEWHYAHLAGLARGGSGLVIAEATAVSPEGRITPGCAGIWSDAQAEAFAPAVRAIKAAGAVPGLQVAHAGRKASANRPWEGDDHIPEGDPRGWTPIAPSPVAQGGGLHRIPREMTIDDIRRVQSDFAAAARRALEAGFEWLELHFAHGYLAQSFFSVHANRRTDEYGGSFENRIRFLVDTFAAVREVWPENLPLTARFGVIEFDGRDEETLAESIELIRRLKELGLDLIDVSMGFTAPEARIPWGAAMLAPIAARVRREADLPTAISWFISDPAQADALVRDGAVDLVMLGRALLENPHWPYVAARVLHKERPAWTLPAPYAHWLDRYRAA